MPFRAESGWVPAARCPGGGLNAGMVGLGRRPTRCRVCPRRAVAGLPGAGRGGVGDHDARVVAGGKAGGSYLAGGGLEGPLAGSGAWVEQPR